VRRATIRLRLVFQQYHTGSSWDPKISTPRHVQRDERLTG